MYVDGMHFRCDEQLLTIGGEHEMTAIIRANNLIENRDYRLVWSYELIPVISHNQTDLDD